MAGADSDGTGGNSLETLLLLLLCIASCGVEVDVGAEVRACVCVCGGVDALDAAALLLEGADDVAKEAGGGRSPACTHD